MLDRDFLEYCEQKEKERVESLRESLRPQETASIRQFFPELALEERQPYTHALQGEPLQTLIPFFSTIIVSVRPCRTSKEFEDLYGLSVGQVLDLERQGRVAIVLTVPPTKYAECDNYILPILEKLPPCFRLRADAFDEVVAGTKASDYAEQAERFFPLKRVGKEAWSRFLSDPAFSQAFMAGLGEPERMHPALLRAFKELSVLGYQEELAHVVAKIARGDIGIAVYVIMLTNFFLGAPTYLALDGTHSVTRRQTMAFRGMAKSLQMPGNVFPVDPGIAKVLVEELTLVRPANLEEGIKVYPDYHRLRSTLVNVQNSLATGSHDISRLTDEVREAVGEANEMIQIHRKLTRTLDYMLVTLGAAGAFAGSLLAGRPSLLDEILRGLPLAAGLFKWTVSNRMVDGVVKLRRPLHVVAVYDFRRKREAANSGHANPILGIRL